VFAPIKKKISDFSRRVHREVLLDRKKLDETFFDFEMTLLESDVALEVCEKITSDLKGRLYGKKIKKDQLEGMIKEALENSLLEIFPKKPKSIVELVREKHPKPYVIVFVGVNGTGKTTTIAKIAHLLQKSGLSCVFAASDTFRAGAMEQLQKHADKLGVRMIRHAKGADPAAVAFDAIEHARAHNRDAVLIDTAGRMETNVNLMDEMKKIVRVAKPDLTLFIGDALTGNAAIDQAEMFDRAVPIEGVILTKADADAKGGSAISISYIIKKPIFFLGTGQKYDDLVEFDPQWFVRQIL
jgi:fused signal recognition particle receptor